MRALENITYRRLAVLLIASGLMFAVSSLTGSAFVYKLWPLLILFPGTGFIGIFLKRRARGSLYLCVGIYLLLFMGLALYCNFTTWSNLADLWSVFIAFLGIAILGVFFYQRKKRLLLFLGLLLLSLAIFFYFVFSVDAGYWWIILILAGMSILLTCRMK